MLVLIFVMPTIQMLANIGEDLQSIDGEVVKIDAEEIQVYANIGDFKYTVTLKINDKTVIQGRTFQKVSLEEMKKELDAGAKLLVHSLCIYTRPIKRNERDALQIVFFEKPKEKEQ